MFERTLNSSWDECSRRGLTTLTSFALQALAVGVLLVVPLLRPTGLPLFRQLSTPVSLGQPQAEPAQPRTHAGGNSAALSNPAEIVLRQPARIPNQIDAVGDDAPLPIGGDGPVILGLRDTGGPGGVLGSVGTGSRPIMPAAPVPAVHAVRLSHMSEGDLIHKILPMYPPLARSARIQGTVVLQAMISKLGTIENLRLVSGHPMLAPAAIEAVRQWRYRPYILNNEPVEVETQITVNFSLAGN
jgi:protein TonB